MKRLVTAGIVGLAMILTAGAEPGKGIHSGPWMASPFVKLAGTYDSNVNKTPDNEKEDWFLDSEAGLRLGYSAYEIDVSGLGFLGARSYSDLSGQNFTQGGEILKLKQGTHDTLVVEADQTFRRIEDIDQYGSEAAVMGVSPDSVLDASARSRRDVNNVGLSVGRNLTDKVQLDVGYRFDDVNYVEPGLFDLQSHIGQAEGAYRLTDKTAGLVTFLGGIQDNNSSSDPANYFTGRVGLKSRGTDKVTYKGGIGIQTYDRPETDAVTTFNYDLSATWIASDKITVQAGGRNGTVLSSLYADNVSEYNSVWAGTYYAVAPTVVLSGQVAFRRDDYSDPVVINGAPESRVDNGTAVRARLDYLTPAKFMRLYTEALYEVTDSTTADNYDETRVSVGLNLQY